MGEAVENPQDAAEFAELPDLTGIPPAEILRSNNPVVTNALLRVVDESTRPQTSAGFGSFIV